MVIKWEESRVQDIIHYFTTTVPKNPRGVLSSHPLSTIHTYSKAPSPLNNIYSICLRTKDYERGSNIIPAVQMATRGSGR